MPRDVLSAGRLTRFTPQGKVDRATVFLRKAGTVIVGICIVLWWLSAYPHVGPPAEAIALIDYAGATVFKPNAMELTSALAAAVTHRVFELLEQTLGLKAVLDFQPMQKGDVPAAAADVSALEKAVHYRPRTPVEVGIPKFVDWYRSYKKQTAAV